jgi:hypothetical protein
MGIVNRRNAMLGWAVWQVGKRVAEQKAKSSVSFVEGGKKKKRRLSKAAFIAGVVAVGGALVFWRKKSPDDELPPV